MEDISLIREDSLQRVIGLLRASFTHLVLDLSKSFAPTDVTALRAADVILLVAQLELSSLRNVVRMVQTLGNNPELADKVKVVLNGVGGESDITLKKAEETIGKPVYWQIPYDAKLMTESRTHGVPLVVHAPRASCSRVSPAWPRRSAARRRRRLSRRSRHGGPCSRDDESNSGQWAAASGQQDRPPTLLPRRTSGGGRTDYRLLTTGAKHRCHDCNAV